MEKNTTNLSTLLINILVAVNAHSHNAHQLGICASIEREREQEKETRREGVKDIYRRAPPHTIRIVNTLVQLIKVTNFLAGRCPAN